MSVYFIGIFTVTVPGIYDITLTVFSGTDADLKMYIMLERDGNISRSVRTKRYRCGQYVPDSTLSVVSMHQGVLYVVSTHQTVTSVSECSRWYRLYADYYTGIMSNITSVGSYAY